MKNRILLLSLFCFSFISLFSQNEEIDGKLVELNNKEDFFELMRQYELYKDSTFFPLTNALLDEKLDLFCNRREAFDKSVRYLINNYQEEIGTSALINDVNKMLKNLFELGRYKEVNEISNYFLPLLYPHNPPIEMIKPLEFMRDVSFELSSYFPKHVVTLKDSNEIPFFFERVGKGDFIFLEGSINGKSPISFVFDTGAECNCAIHEKYVDDYNIRKLNSKQTLQGHVTQQEVSMGVVDSLLFGDIVIYNIPVFILPDEEKIQSNNEGFFNTPDSIKNSKQAIIGRTLMETLGEIHIYPQKETMCIVKSDFSTNRKVNMMLYYGGIPFVELFSDDKKRLSFLLDTGASTSTLSSLYYENNEDWILKTLTPSKARFGEIGGAYETDIYTLPHLSLQLGNTPFELKNVMITPTIPQRHASGSLGADFIRLFDKVVLDFKNMYIEVEK